MLKSPRPKHPLNSGFTLVELVVTVSIVAILATVAVPNFRNFVLNNRIKATSQELLRTLQTARSEATKQQINPVNQSIPVNTVVCLTNSATTCITGNTKANGWILFYDFNNDWTYGSGDTLIKIYTLPSTYISVLSDGAKRVSFSKTGFTTVGSGTSPQINSSGFVICDARGNAVSSGSLSVARGISVSGTGRASITDSQSNISSLISASGQSCT